MLTIFIGAYILSSVGDAVSEMFDIRERGWIRYFMIILVTLILDWCTIGITLYLNYSKTRQLAAKKMLDVNSTFFRNGHYSSSTNTESKDNEQTHNSYQVVSQTSQVRSRNLDAESQGSLQTTDIFALAGDWADNLREKKSFSNKFNFIGTSTDSHDRLLRPRSTQ